MLRIGIHLLFGALTIIWDLEFGVWNFISDTAVGFSNIKINL